MIWGPFLLALALGLLVSAGLYFAYLWPQVEPDDDEGDDAPTGSADAPGTPPGTPAVAPSAGEPTAQDAPA